jgi:hypothetical protein
MFAYNNYIDEMFALSGSKDITNVLVAKLDNKTTTQAYLYDLLIADRNVIVYRPEFPTASLDDLTLHLHIPTDEDFNTSPIVCYHTSRWTALSCPSTTWRVGSTATKTMATLTTIRSNI